MRLAALLALGFAAAVTVGCSSGRYVANSGASRAASGPSYNTGTASVATRRAMPAPRVVRRSAPAPTSPVTYASRSHLASPPPPPPPALPRSYKSTSTPVRSASTVRAPSRSLPARSAYRSAPADAPAPGNVASGYVMAPPAFAAPAAPAYVAPQPSTARCAPRTAVPARTIRPRKRRISPMRRKIRPPTPAFGAINCRGGT